jgi:hypothetical protein
MFDDRITVCSIFSSGPGSSTRMMQSILTSTSKHLSPRCTAVFLNGLVRKFSARRLKQVLHVTTVVGSHDRDGGLIFLTMPNLREQKTSAAQPFYIAAGWKLQDSNSLRILNVAAEAPDSIYQNRFRNCLLLSVRLLDSIVLTLTSHESSWSTLYQQPFRFPGNH